MSRSDHDSHRNEIDNRSAPQTNPPPESLTEGSDCQAAKECSNDHQATDQLLYRRIDVPSRRRCRRPVAVHLEKSWHGEEAADECVVETILECSDCGDKANE